MTGVYLLHFEPRYKHAQHYLGFADDIGRRVYEHEMSGSGAKLPDAARKAGVEMYLARFWEGKDRNFERKLKGRKRRPDGSASHHTGSLRRLCPICKGTKAPAEIALRAAMRAEVA